ncbi:hypothetical protein [Tabrizicola sp.]|uniref:hypothetical protein n=1 Tax=Tabrizicola sp. TaxID=2005166 RepID=UPI00286D04D3|nr:hypothetical protein [Tabrizicola sp.]
MRRQLILACFLLTPVIAAPALSGPLTDAAASADAAIAAGDFDAWYAANEVLIETAWNAAGLHFGNLVATTGPATAYGAYEPRASTVYAAGEPVELYIEPRGYGYGDLGGGQLEIAFDIDLRVLEPSGSVVMEQENFANFVVKTRARSRELMVNLTATFDGAPAGNYTLEFTFKDRHSDQTASFTNDITLQ